MTVPFIEKTGSNIDELREIIVKRTEAVGDPCTDGGFVRIKHMSPRMKLDLCPVVVVSGPHRANNGQVIHLLANMWEPVTDHCSAFTILFVASLQRVKFITLLSIGITYHHDPLVFEFFRIKNIGVRRVWYGLSRVVIKCRLWIEAFHVADPATHKKPNDTFSFGLRSRARTAQHGIKGHAAKPKACTSEKLTAIDGVGEGWIDHEKKRRELSNGKKIIVSEKGVGKAGTVWDLFQKCEAFFKFFVRG